MPELHRMLLAAPARAPGDVHLTEDHEPVHFGPFVCGNTHCACQRAFVGVRSVRESSLARVAFSAETLDTQDLFVRAALELAAHYPEGTLLRVRYAFATSDARGTPYAARGARLTVPKDWKVFLYVEPSNDETETP